MTSKAEANPSATRSHASRTAAAPSSPPPSSTFTIGRSISVPFTYRGSAATETR